MTDAGLFSLFSLLYEGHKVLYKQLLAWILQGSLFDPYDEFFIVPDGSSNNPSDQAPMATSSLSSSSAQVIEKFLLATLTYVIFLFVSIGPSFQAPFSSLSCHIRVRNY